MDEKKLSFKETLERLLAEEQLTDPQMFQFSDMQAKELSELQAVWTQISITVKEHLLAELDLLAENNYLLSFDGFARSLLDDADAPIRAAAIRLLDETDDLQLAPVYIHLLESDPDPLTRAEAAHALGLFVYNAEMEEVPAALQKEIEDALIRAAGDAKNEIAQRYAIESLGYSSRAEVPALLESAYWHEESKWTASAVIAMGRSSNTRWQEDVLRALANENNAIRLAATQAAGDLELSAARDALLQMLEDEDDEEVFSAAVWSLSQIGGEDVRTYLEALLDKLDDDEENEQIEFIEDALENLSFTDDFQQLDMLAYDAEDPLEEE